MIPGAQTLHTNWLFVVGLLLALTGCSKPETYTYSPREGVTFIVALKKLEPKPEHKSVFLYFDLTIKNESSKRMYFNPGEMKAMLNGKPSEFVYYDSLASVMPEKKDLAKGISTYQLYFTFKDAIDRKPVEFVLADFGLSE
jgi:hypothetical protein